MDLTQSEQTGYTFESCLTTSPEIEKLDGRGTRSRLYYMYIQR